MTIVIVAEWVAQQWKEVSMFLLRWRTDKTAAQADTLDTLRMLLPPELI